MRVFKPLTAYERAAAESRSKLRAAIRAMPPIDRIVAAKSAVVGRTKRVQGMRPSKAYADTPRGTELYLRDKANRPEKIIRDDRVLPTIPRVYVPRSPRRPPDTPLRYRNHDALADIRAFSGAARRPKGK